MLDKRQFDLEMDNARREQVTELADYLAGYIRLNSQIRGMKISSEPDEVTLRKIADTPIPLTGRDPREVADELVENVFQRGMLVQHPRFFSFVAGAVSPYSLAGSILTDIYNPHGGGWNEAPGACLIEEKLIKWMGSLAGYPEDTVGGLFVSGGSMANITALCAARGSRLAETEYPLGVAYLSDQTHSSVAKGLRIIGFRADQIVRIPTDDDFRIRPDLLEEAVRRDLADGKKPFVVVGTMGTTNTGAIDPLPELAAICRKYGMWFHIDGAYGGSILISDIYRNYAKGVELSDSLSWDTHKWAMQTYSCSSVVVRDKNDLLAVFSEHPEYLADTRSAEHSDPWDLGPEMSRPHRAIKLWFTLQAMGTDKLADVIDYSFYNARLAERRLAQYENWELTSKPMCGTLTFRYAPAGYSPAELDELSAAISRRVIEEDCAYIVTSVIKGRRVLRLCLINGNTTSEDVTETIDRLDAIARELTGL